MKIQGFYRCECGKFHTFCPGFTVVTCSCGLAIDQLRKAYGVKPRA